MAERCLTAKTLAQFKSHLIAEERSAATVEKYLRDTAAFAAYAGGAALTKETVIGYKRRFRKGMPFAVSIPYWPQ